MRKLFSSSFFILSAIAILSGVIGAWLSGMWDPTPPEKSIFSRGSYLDGAGFGAMFAIIGLVPYWIFHLLVGDAAVSWSSTKNKIWRVAWVVFWAGFPAYFFSLGLGV